MIMYKKNLKFDELEKVGKSHQPKVQQLKKMNYEIKIKITNFNNFVFVDESTIRLNECP